MAWLAAWTAACVLPPAGEWPEPEHPAGAPATARATEPAAFPVDRAAPGPLAPDKAVGDIAVQPHLTTIQVYGFPDATVALPFDLGRRSPLVVVLHGLGDRPAPHCEAWRTITTAHAFVLCPRGEYDPDHSTALGPRFTLPGGWVLREHVDHAISALVARFGPAVDARHPLLAGFSLGATEAAVLAQEQPARFTRVAVVEGGLDVWVPPMLDAFTLRGGRRVLFGCGSGWCGAPARRAAARIDAAGGTEARIAEADVGHHDAPELQAALREELAWFVDGDARYDDP